jgi:transposase InsO family protein
VPQQARTERAGRGTHPDDSRTQVAHSTVRLSTDCANHSQTFGIDIDKNVVYRVLSQHYRPAPGGTGPLWLSFIGHTTDSLWSVDRFRCESIVLRSYWVLVVMDQFTRRLVGIGVHGGAVTDADVCRMFNVAIRGQGTPRHLSTDHDPVFEAHRWAANLPMLEIDEIKTVRMSRCPTRSWSA